MDTAGIYAIECLANGLFYIGSSARISRRWYEHRRKLALGQHHAPHLQQCWNKYGKDMFRLKVLEECPRERLLEREQAYLDALQPAFNTCLLAGSRAGVPASDETKEKVRRANLGQVRTAEQRANISAALKGIPKPHLKGVPRPPEVVEKMRAARIGKPRSPEVRAKVAAAVSAALKGKKLSEEHRAKLSAAQRGRKATDETRAKIRASSLGKEMTTLRGVPRSPEVREKIAAAQRGKPKPYLVGHEVSAETREKIGASKRGKPLSAEHRAKLSAAHRRSSPLSE